jgi:hypothetical protein
VPPRESQLEDLKSKLAGLVKEFSNQQSGPVTIQRFGAFLKRRWPDFNPKRMGCRSVGTLLRRLGGFELKRIRNDAGIIIDYGLTLGSRQTRDNPTANGL